MRIGKKAPMKVRKVIVPSLLGQNRMDRGSHASGGIGRKSSSTGKAVSLNLRYIPKASPSASASTAAIANPANTRCELPSPLSQEDDAQTMRANPAATYPGQGR